MKVFHGSWLAVFFGMACFMGGLPAEAAPQFGGVYATVERVQMSAWIERSGARKPLRPGQTLQNYDTLFTDAQARAVIQFADGSTLKLGENAELRLNALDYRDDLVFTAALELIRGALRLTSGALPVQRALNVRIATITAGLRSADLWGVANERGDLLCLLKGQIMTLHAKDDERFLSDPLSCYFAPQGAAGQPLDDVNATQLRLWLQQTELQSGFANAVRADPLKTGVSTVDSEARALEIYDQARQAGYSAAIQPRRMKGGTTHYRVSVSQLPPSTSNTKD
jgi:hypothetical protein